MAKKTSAITSISLTPELLSMINKRVSSGLYTSTSEVIREALRVFFKHEDTTSEEDVTSALSMMEFGIELTKARLEDEHPELSEDQVYQLLHQELKKRPRAPYEAAPSAERLKRLLREHES